MEKKLFGTLADGREVYAYTITNKNNVSVTVTDFGASWLTMMVPDKDGIVRDVVLGYDTPQDYIAGTCYIGSVIGRSGNRIANAAFTINGKEYHLTPNENENNLHSGPDGYQLRVWDVAEVTEDSVRFELFSPDGDQGFPGNFKVALTYTLTEENELKLHYEGVSDADTVANLTHHSYFNLGGHDSGNTKDHLLMINAEYYTPVHCPKSIPTGELAPVEGTPFDFRTAKPIGREIDVDFEQLTFTGGYDHNFALSKEFGTQKKMAEVYCEKTGIFMEAFTDCCGMQFYAGNAIKPHTGKGGVAYDKRHAICLESQYYPNAINQEGFASPLLKAGEKYDTTTSYKFSVK